MKKILLGVCVALFGPIIVLLATTFAFNRTIGQPEFVKTTFRNAKIYEDLHTLVAQQLEGTDTSQENSLVIDSIKETVTPDVIQRMFEQVIDGVYAWMDGTTPKVEFTIELEPIKQGIIDTLSKKLSDRAATLPACTYYNLPSTTDIFSIDCIPPGTNVNAVINQAINDTLNNSEILPNSQLTADNINGSSNGNAGSFNDQLNNNNGELLRASYQFVKKGLPYFIVGTVLLAVGILMLSKTKLRGLRKISVLLLINGLLILGISLLMQALVRSLVPESAGDNQAINNSLELSARLIVEAYAALTRNFGIAFSAIGLVGVIGSSVAIAKIEPNRPSAEDMHQKLKDDHPPATPGTKDAANK